MNVSRSVVTAKMIQTVLTNLKVNGIFYGVAAPSDDRLFQNFQSRPLVSFSTKGTISMISESDF